MIDVAERSLLLYIVVAKFSERERFHHPNAAIDFNPVDLRSLNFKGWLDPSVP